MGKLFDPEYRKTVRIALEGGSLGKVLSKKPLTEGVIPSDEPAPRLPTGGSLLWLASDPPQIKIGNRCYVPDELLILAVLDNNPWLASFAIDAGAGVNRHFASIPESDTPFLPFASPNRAEVYTPLKLARKAGRRRMAQFLIDAGADG